METRRAARALFRFIMFNPVNPVSMPGFMVLASWALFQTRAEV